MRKRAEINIEIADHLNKLTRKEICTTYNNNIQNNADIRHIIIGRWYYGLFLLAKDKLINDYNFITNCEEKNTCHHNKSNGFCNAKCLKHKSFRKTEPDGTVSISNLSIWAHIAEEYPPEKRKFIIRGENFAYLREDFEYTGKTCRHSHIQKATEYFKGVIDVIK